MSNARGSMTRTHGAEVAVHLLRKPDKTWCGRNLAKDVPDNVIQTHVLNGRQVIDVTWSLTRYNCAKCRERRDL